MTKSHWLLKALSGVNLFALMGGIVSLAITATALYFGIKMEIALMKRDVAALDASVGEVKRDVAAIRQLFSHRFASVPQQRALPHAGDQDNP